MRNMEELQRALANDIRTPNASHSTVCKMWFGVAREAQTAFSLDPFIISLQGLAAFVMVSVGWGTMLVAGEHDSGLDIAESWFPTFCRVSEGRS